MSDTKLSALTELAVAAAADDELYIRDVSEDPADESKRITVANLSAGISPSVSAGDANYYVDYTNGLDSNTGTEVAPFKTLAKIISMVPDIILNGHTYTLYLKTDTWDEQLTLEGRSILGTLIIRGDTTTATNHKVAGIWVLKCIGRIAFYYMESTRVDYHAIEVAGTTGYISFYKITVTQTDAVYSGALFEEGMIYVRDCTFSNRRAGILSNANAKVWSWNCDGTGNTIGIYAISGGMVSCQGTQPTGTTNYKVDTGGLIVKDSGSILPVIRVEQSYQNILDNGNFEVGDTPVGWSLVGSAWERSTEQVKVGSYSGKLTRGATSAYAHQSVANYVYYRGKQMTLGAWVYATDADNARLWLYDNVDSTLGAKHSGVSGWEWLTVTHTIDASATVISARLYLMVNSTSAYFDGAMLVEGDKCPAFSPKPAETLINHHAAAYTVSAYETGQVLHSNFGAGGAVVITLPQTVTSGFTVRFAVLTAQELRIDPGAAGAVYINGTKQTDNKYISANDEAESVVLTAVGNGDWIASSVVGTWSVES